MNYFRAAGKKHVCDRFAALSELADETAVWQPHRDGNCAVTLSTDSVTPVFKFESAEKDSACDRILKVGSAARKGSAPPGGAEPQEAPSIQDRAEIRGLSGPEPDHVPPNPRTVSEARALEAERPFTAEEAQRCAAHTRSRAPQGSKLTPGQLAWLQRLRSGDLTGSGVPEGQFPAIAKPGSSSRRRPLHRSV